MGQINVKPGDIVKVCEWRSPRASRAIVIRIYTDGGIRAVPINTPIGDQIVSAVAAGDVQSLVPLVDEIEAASFEYFTTEYRELKETRCQFQ